MARGILVGLTLVLPAAAFVRGKAAPGGFPHAAHAGLFPLCTGCHVGVLTGAPAEVFPSTALCARCHDGVDLTAVVWEGYDRRPDNVAFDHVEHARGLVREGEPDPGCQGCHSASPEERMKVEGRPEPTRCLTCHAHQASEHLVDAECATCHVPLTASGFDRARIAALPKPADHEGQTFLAQVHGAAATTGTERCATCHVQERCTACHVDPTLPAIRSIPGAPPGMELPPFTAHYVAPASHNTVEWLDDHGSQASLASCGTCHTRQSCILCHQEAPPPAVLTLPQSGEVRAPGAQTEARAPASHQGAFFATDHGSTAAADAKACATCHSGLFCVACHLQAERKNLAPIAAAIPPRLVELLRSELGAGARSGFTPVGARTVGVAPTLESRPAASGPDFHPADFTFRHASAAYGQTMECANCHSVEVFCKACHVEAGLAPAARPGPGFHDARPVWLLGHGQAARQNLESCASCHRQGDCVQCHSTVGAFRVNPHGPGFDAERGWARAPETCLACHLGKPTPRANR